MKTMNLTLETYDFKVWCKPTLTQPNCISYWPWIKVQLHPEPKGVEVEWPHENSTCRETFRNILDSVRPDLYMDIAQYKVKSVSLPLTAKQYHDLLAHCVVKIQKL